MQDGLWKELLQKIEDKVRALYAEYTHDYLIYHNIHHTESVVKNAVEIADHYHLDDEAMFILQAAAWFHDAGQLFTTPFLHEEESVRIVNNFLEGTEGISTAVITAIDSCIMATKMPQRAQSLIEQILCDADLYHLGTDKFWNINEAVKEEAVLRGFDITHWDAGTLKLLQMHHYYTDYCQQLLDKGKAGNIERLRILLSNG